MCMYFKARSDVARMTFAFYGPFAFVIGGTQHVIANVGFLGLPLLLNLFHASAPRGGISWGFGSDGLLTNICITIVGNLIGGTLFVALPFWMVRAAATAAAIAGTPVPYPACVEWRMRHTWTAVEAADKPVKVEVEMLGTAIEAARC
jgi:hypothetical protein